MTTAHSRCPGEPGYVPQLRPARPWLMEEMIGAEPELRREEAPQRAAADAAQAWQPDSGDASHD